MEGTSQWESRCSHGILVVVWMGNSAESIGRVVKVLDDEGNDEEPDH